MYINGELTEFLRLAGDAYKQNPLYTTHQQCMIAIILAPAHRKDVQENVIPSLGYVHAISGTYLHFFAAGYRAPSDAKTLERYQTADLVFDNNSFATTVNELEIIFAAARKPFKYYGEPEILLCLVNIYNNMAEIHDADYVRISLAPTANGDLTFDNLAHRWLDVVKEFWGSQLLDVAEREDRVLRAGGYLRAFVRYAVSRPEVFVKLGLGH